MSKIRPVHPDIWTDDEFVSVSPWARLLYVGMWNFACDNGHLEDRSRQIKRRVLPFDDVNVAELLRELDTVGLIVVANGWVTIPAAAKRWRLDLRYWKGCDKPGCRKPKRETRRVLDGDPLGTRGDHVADGDGDGDGETAAAAADAAAAAPIDPTLDVFRAKIQAHTRLQALRFDTLGPAQAQLLVSLIEKHGDDRLVKVALDTCKATPPVHVSAFLGTWEALPAPGVRLAAVEQRFCPTHPWQRRTAGGVCTACASEQIAEGANA